MTDHSARHVATELARPSIRWIMIVIWSVIQLNAAGNILRVHC